MLLPLLALLLGACGGSSGATDDPEQQTAVPEAKRYGGTAVASIAVDPQSLNILGAPLRSTPARPS